MQTSNQSTFHFLFFFHQITTAANPREMGRQFGRLCRALFHCLRVLLYSQHSRQTIAIRSYVCLKVVQEIQSVHIPMIVAHYWVEDSRYRGKALREEPCRSVDF